MSPGVPLMLGVVVALAAGVAAPRGGAQELPIGRDHGRDRALAAEQRHGCAEQRLDVARGDAAGRAEGPFAAASAEADGLRRQFGQADRDGDGRISREEWLAWFGPAQAGATTSTQGRP
jgi:hypothetical protein